MKVLLFNAGAKNYGATQEILLTIKDDVLRDNNADVVCIGDMDIKYCKGCKVCYDTCECVHEDDMKYVIDLIDTSDVIIVAAPSYWADIPGQFKVFIDRCTAYSETNPNAGHRELAGGKRCYAIALRTGTRPTECEHIIDTISHWCGHMKINMSGSMYFCGIVDKNDIGKHKPSIRSKASEWLFG